ncbi:hypothetical protein [Ancylobacter sp.]|uniref:hypothetical protein n=1 Tax=Ancylobacter sp. TaxID=1872567 RepID=UPI003D14D3F3
MSECYWDSDLERPLHTREGRRLRTLREAYEFVRDRCAYPGHPLVRTSLGALSAAAQTGQVHDARRALERTARLMRANHWGWG